MVGKAGERGQRVANWGGTDRANEGRWIVERRGRGERGSRGGGAKAEHATGREDSAKRGLGRSLRGANAEVVNGFFSCGV